jgi:hypothetical protein
MSEGTPAKVRDHEAGAKPSAGVQEFLTLLSFPTNSSDPCASRRGTSPAASHLCSTSCPGRLEQSHGLSHGGSHGARSSSQACPSSLPKMSQGGPAGPVFDTRSPECDTFVHPSEVYMRRSPYSAPAERYRRRSADLHRDKWRQAMIAAVTTILHELGEDVGREVWH